MSTVGGPGNVMKGSGHSFGGGMRSEGAFGGAMSALTFGMGSSSQQQANFMHATRASKRLYVGNLPHNVSEEEIRKFFNATMIAAKPEEAAGGGAVDGEQSVTNVYLNAQKRYCSALCGQGSTTLFTL